MPYFQEKKLTELGLSFADPEEMADFLFESNRQMEERICRTLLEKLPDGAGLEWEILSDGGLPAWQDWLRSRHPDFAQGDIFCKCRAAGRTPSESEAVTAQILWWEENSPFCREAIENVWEQMCEELAEEGTRANQSELGRERPC